jgi:mono/diheme cytochrome c family protein
VNFPITMAGLALITLPALGLARAFEDVDRKEGATIYQTHCESCHGPGGQPDFPDLPDFGRGEGLNKSDLVLAEYLRNGDRGHPVFRGLMDEREILEVLSYLRKIQR